jgi:hypothetical protein
MKKRNHETDECKSELFNLDKANPELSKKIKKGEWLDDEDLDYGLYTSPPEPDYIKMNLQPLFIENESFQPVRELIDEKFEAFFTKFASLNKHRKEVKKNKDNLLHVFYNIVFQRIIHDSNLMNAKEFINQSKKKIENGDNNIYKRIAVKAGLEHFTPIIDEVFAMPNLVLSAFEKSDIDYKRIMNENKPKIERADKMTGKKLSKEKETFYLDILAKQEELVNLYGVNQTSSLLNTIRMIDNKLTAKQVKTTAENIRYHKKEGNLPK